MASSLKKPWKICGIRQSPARISDWLFSKSQVFSEEVSRQLPWPMTENDILGDARRTQTQKEPKQQSKDNTLWHFLIGIPMSQDTCPILISLFIWFRGFFILNHLSGTENGFLPTLYVRSSNYIRKKSDGYSNWMRNNVVWFFILLPTCIEMISKEKRRSLKIIQNPSYVYFFQIHVNHQRRVTTSQKNQRQHQYKMPLIGFVNPLFKKFLIQYYRIINLKFDLTTGT